MKNKVAMITGAAVGIGRAVAILMAQKGAKLVLLDIDAEKLEQKIREKMKHQEEVAKQYNIMGGTFVNLQRGIMRDVLELVKNEEEVKQ